MRKAWMGVLAVVALFAVLAGPAAAEEGNKVWRLNGKRWEFVPEKLTPAPEATTVRVEVPKAEAETWGYRTVGKKTERVYYREVPRPAPVVEKGHFCNLRVETHGKRTVWHHFCKVNGVEKPCPGMNAAGECLAVAE